MMLKDRLAELDSELITLDLAATCQAAKRVLEVLDRATRKNVNGVAMVQLCTGDVAKLGNYLTRLTDRIADDLGVKCILARTQSQAHLYEIGEQAFGRDVILKFPPASFEIDEAAKCLSLRRPTAAVFHLMRLMELAIQAVARCLGIPDPTTPAEKNWGVILRKIKDEVDRRNQAKNWNNPNDRQFFESVYASLDAVRIAWRNPTMHVERKYVDEEAEHVFGAVRGLMTTLSNRLDCEGKPVAEKPFPLEELEAFGPDHARQCRHGIEESCAPEQLDLKPSTTEAPPTLAQSTASMSATYSQPGAFLLQSAR